ncbi:hypothetical protein [Streptomyces cyaneofuscatus]|nr:hypothetical protein OG973_09300 [Streptomyces cyaneofuscatus]
MGRQVADHRAVGIRGGEVGGDAEQWRSSAAGMEFGPSGKVLAAGGIQA